MIQLSVLGETLTVAGILATCEIRRYLIALIHGIRLL